MATDVVEGQWLLSERIAVALVPSEYAPNRVHVRVLVDEDTEADVWVTTSHACEIAAALSSLVEGRDELAEVLRGRHHFRSALRHAQTNLAVALSSVMKAKTDIDVALDDEHGLPRGFEHEPEGDGLPGLERSLSPDEEKRLEAFLANLPPGEMDMDPEERDCFNCRHDGTGTESSGDPSWPCTSCGEGCTSWEPREDDEEHQDIVKWLRETLELLASGRWGLPLGSTMVLTNRLAEAAGEIERLRTECGEVFKDHLAQIGYEAVCRERDEARKEAEAMRAERDVAVAEARGAGASNRRVASHYMDEVRTLECRLQQVEEDRAFWKRRTMDVQDECRRLRTRIAFIGEADEGLAVLRLYADPGFYHGVSFAFDRPSGGFEADFDEEHGDPAYDGPMPGKAARAALAKEGECDGT